MCTYAVCQDHLTNHQPSIGTSSIHMQNRQPLGSGLRCQIPALPNTLYTIPVDNTHSPQRQASHSHGGWAQTVVACTRFEEGILRCFCCSCLYILVCCAACLPQVALDRSIFGRHVHKGDSAEKTTLCLKGRLCNARKQAGSERVATATESAVQQLSPDPCTFSIYIRPD